LQSAYLLITHGSRDPRPQHALEQLAALVTQDLSLRFPSPKLAPLVGTAVLELAALTLHEQIQQFAETAIAVGYPKITLLPLFLLPGVHVMEDIPAEVAIAQAKIQAQIQEISLELAPHLGSYPELAAVLSQSASQLIASDRILMAHGSRRSGANQPIEAIAAALQALPAYWSVSPGLPEQISQLVAQGCTRIAILPYFLFAGGITDAIAQQVSQLAQQFPQTRLELGNPIGTTPALAQLIVDRLVKPQKS
jgi:sirohydrochlorin cobaltochelatase